MLNTKTWDDKIASKICTGTGKTARCTKKNP